MYRLRHILSLFAVALLYAACTQDDEQSSNSLSDGQYPLVLTASVEGMTTRSTGKDAWTGDGTEYIGVRMVTGDTTEESKYVIGNTAGTSVQPADGSETLYWQNSDPATITSWYPYDEQTDVDISDQSSLDDLSSIDYLTATAEDQLYGNTVELKFRHQMAKVSYTLTNGDGISADDLTNAIVLFAGYTTASFSEGVLTTSETENGWITPTAEDLLLVPQNMTGEQFIKVSVNGSSYVFTPTEDTDANLQPGNHYTYNIIVSAEGLEVAVSSIAWNEGTSASETVYIGDGYTYTTDANGTRTYTVTTENGLNAWAEYTRTTDMTTICTLGADITLTAVDTEEGSNWTAVGDMSNAYTGTFDGNGYTITNLTISASSGCQGLIGSLGSGGVVKNLTLAEVNISSNGAMCLVGGVVGYNGGSVTACCVSGTFTGTDYSYVGGVVGYNGGSVTACYSTGTVSGYNAGGVVGRNFDTVTACYSTASVSGSSRMGGVVGYSYEATITACYATGSVVGQNEGGSFTASGTVSADFTWTDAAEAMNETLTNNGYSWQYVANKEYDGTDTTIAPLLLEATTE